MSLPSLLSRQHLRGLQKERPSRSRGGNLWHRKHITTFAELGEGHMQTRTLLPPPTSVTFPFESSQSELRRSKEDTFVIDLRDAFKKPLSLSRVAGFLVALILRQEIWTRSSYDRREGRRCGSKYSQYLLFVLLWSEVLGRRNALLLLNPYPPFSMLHKPRLGICMSLHRFIGC